MNSVDEKFYKSSLYLMIFNRYMLIDLVRGSDKKSSVSQLAALVKYTERQVSRWIAGEAPPPRSAVEVIAKEYGIPVDAFYSPTRLTDDETQLVNAFRRLNRISRAKLTIYMDELETLQSKLIIPVEPIATSEQLGNETKNLRSLRKGNKRRKKDVG